MAAAASPPQTDKDLASIAEARALARRAKLAQTTLAEFSQDQIDRIVEAMATAVAPHAESLARLAVEETTFGVVADKTQKNLFAAQRVFEFIKPMKTVGVINRIEDRKIIEIAEPFGVVAAVIPSTNPTSTAIYKILIAIKARCAVVLTPHPSAARCITRTADIMNEAGRRAGLPDGAIGWMHTVTLEGTQELMRAREVSVILATGGMGHTMSIHSQNDAVILEFGLHKPAYRICVNTPTTHGSIGLTTGLDPAMTLGCGGFGGNITSDNISPKHLLNIKRVAYELRPAQPSASVPSAPTLPKAPAKPQPESISADALTSRIDKFLATRGLAPASASARPEAGELRRDLAEAASGREGGPQAPAVPEKFVCEDDVRLAIKEGRKLLVGERTIVTPSARDAGEAAKVFVQAGWPSVNS